MHTLPPSPPHSDRTYWLCQFGGWGALALSQYLGLVFTVPLSWPRAALEVAAIFGTSLFLSHLLRGYMRRHRWGELSAWARVPRVLIASLILGLPVGVAYHAMSIGQLSQAKNEAVLKELADSGIHISNEAVTLAPTMLQPMINLSGNFATWMILYFIIIGIRKRREAELQRSEMARALQLAELRLLKGQLNPHFLFNSLNSVRALIAEDPKRAQNAVTQLARTLRYTLDSGQEELVTLEQELKIVDDYLALEALRLDTRLTIQREISPEVLRVRIPVMLLQTVVENAIKHGIAELPAGGVLRLGARIVDGALSLEVENPRPPHAAPSAHEGHEGIGLRNAAERLRLLFGEQAKLDLDLADPQRAVARIRIPLAQ